MSASVPQLVQWLAQAETAFARNRSEPVAPDAVLRSLPACGEGCPECTIRCAVVQGIVADLRAQLASALQAQTEALTHNGRFYVAAEGRA